MQIVKPVGGKVTRTLNHFLGAVMATAILTYGAAAYGQAWVGEENSLELDLTYHYTDANGHYGGVLEGSDTLQAVDLDHVRAHTIQLGGEYTTPLRGLAVSASTFIMRPDFVGNPMYLPHGAEHTCTMTMPPVCGYQDTGTKLTDLMFDARYQLPVSPAKFAITPVAGVTVPLTDYPVIGHAGYGKGLYQGRIGLDVGRTLDPILPRAYIDALYTYSVIEDVDDNPVAASFGNNRSDARLQLGYFILPKLSAWTGGTWRHVHGGYSWGDLQPVFRGIMSGVPPTPEQMVQLGLHDQLGAERAWIVYGGLGYEAISNLWLRANVLKVVKGDSVPNTFGVSFGLSWAAF